MYDFTHDKTIGKLEKGCRLASVVEELWSDKSIVSWVLKAFQNSSTAVR